MVKGQPHETYGYGLTTKNRSLHWKLTHCNHGSLFSMKWWGPSVSKGGRMIWISRGIWSKFGCMSQKSIKWRGHPLPSMVFDNPWLYSMVWFQSTLYFAHPWYFTTYGFDPWYFPKKHCNNVIKKDLFLLNKAFKDFWHPTLLLFYWVIGLLVLSSFLSMVWEVRLK